MKEKFQLSVFSPHTNLCTPTPHRGFLLLLSLQKSENCYDSNVLFSLVTRQKNISRVLLSFNEKHAAALKKGPA